MIFDFLEGKENIDIVCSEIYEILKNIEKNKVMKIPSEILEMIKEHRNPNLKVNINWNEPLENQNLNKDTINLLGWINLNFWAETEEERDRLIKLFYSKNITLYKKK